MTTRPSRRRAVPPSVAAPLLSVVAVMAVVLAVTATPAAAATTNTDPASGAAGWLARQLVDGERFESTYGEDTYADQGLTLDAILAFASAHAAGTYATNAINWLDDPTIADGYYGSYDSDPATATAGALAKLILGVEVMGGDPTSFAGGVDLVSLLVTLEDPTTGRFADTGPYGDYANMFGQALAVVALARTGDHDSAAATAADYIESIECADGGFPLDLAPPADPADCDAQVDATAMAVQALLAVGRDSDAAAGLDWLVGKQHSDGGFDPDDGFTGENTNSTGLAGQALRAAGRDSAADAAQAYLLSRQVACDGPTDQVGGIAYDADPFDASTATRATAQAILGLGGASLAELSITGADVDAPTLTCAASPSASASNPAGILPVTGSSLTGVVVAGVVLVGAGAGLVVAARRRRQARV